MASCVRFVLQTSKLRHQLGRGTQIDIQLAPWAAPFAFFQSQPELSSLVEAKLTNVFFSKFSSETRSEGIEYEIENDARTMGKFAQKTKEQYE